MGMWWRGGEGEVGMSGVGQATREGDGKKWRSQILEELGKRGSTKGRERKKESLFGG